MSKNEADRLAELIRHALSNRIIQDDLDEALTRVDELAALAKQQASKTTQAADTLILDWLERQHTLHRCVEAFYAVDGYDVCVNHDGTPIGGRSWFGATLREAYTKMMQDWDVTHGNTVLIDNVRR